MVSFTGFPSVLVLCRGFTCLLYLKQTNKKYNLLLGHLTPVVWIGTAWCCTMGRVCVSMCSFFEYGTPVLKRNQTHCEWTDFVTVLGRESGDGGDAALMAFSFFLLKTSTLQAASKSTQSVIRSRTWIAPNPKVFLTGIYNNASENFGLDYTADGPYFVLLRSVCYSCLFTTRGSITVLNAGTSLQCSC